MMDGRSPRIPLFLTIWTLLLIGLVLVEIRRLPLGLTMLLVPYLALMASHWVGRLRQRSKIEPAIPRHDEAESSPDDGSDAAEFPPDDELDEHADSPGIDGCSGCDDSPQPTLPRMIEEPATPPSRRNRVRRRPRAPETKPSAASWTQVQPGRFVRVEQLQPGEPADEPVSDGWPDEPHEPTPLDEPVAPPEAVSIPADADTDVAESQIQIEVQTAGQDTEGATAPSDR